MEIEGLDYNTQREKLVLPAYGRSLQQMVDYAISLTDRNERQVCAEAIVEVMRRIAPQTLNDENQTNSLWEHLAIMSNFKLDIDWPIAIDDTKKIANKPDKVPYPSKRIPGRHYGSMMQEVFDQLKTMPAGEERDELVRLIANQMKRDLMQYSHGSSDDEKVASDLARFTDGKIQLDLDNFRFEADIQQNGGKSGGQSKKRKKK